MGKEDAHAKRQHEVSFRPLVLFFWFATENTRGEAAQSNGESDCRGAPQGLGAKRVCEGMAFLLYLMNCTGPTTRTHNIWPELLEDWPVVLRARCVATGNMEIKNT